jgi:hypothetical protein
VRSRAAERAPAPAAKPQSDPAARNAAALSPAPPTPPALEIESVEKCVNCRFYDRRHAKPLDGKAPLWGQCRRHAPQLNPNPINAKAYVVEGIWPLVRDDDWCGEWKVILRAEEWLPEEAQAPAAADSLPPIAPREPRAAATLGDD